MNPRVDIRTPARARWRVVPPHRAMTGLWIAALLALGSNEAGAAALGSVATSVGLLAALAALFMIKGWPAHMPATMLSTAGGMLLVIGGAAWLWRARAAQRCSGFSGPVAPAAFGSDEWFRPRPRPATGLTLPDGFEPGPLLAELRLHFVRLQAAWDRGEMPALRALTTPEMLEELRSELRGCTDPMEPNRTDVVTLHAELLGFEELGGAFLASVEFSGLIRESSGRGAAPFRELWMFAKAKHDGSGWRLARHQALL